MGSSLKSNNIKTDFLIVGAGFSGAVLARELAIHLNSQIRVIDSRSHVAGNCHTARDSTTDVMIHHYGPHIFNTNHEDVWKYINQFGRILPYVNRVKAVTCKGVFSLPINLLTINQLFGKTLNPQEAKKFVANLGKACVQDSKNFEDQALKMLGKDLYETFFYGYTKKQWGVEPKKLPASILKRLPVRFDYNDSYYNTKYQGIPENGYTEIIQKILDHKNIRVELSTEFHPESKSAKQHVFYSGPIDSFFCHRLGRLGYRTVEFERFEGEGDLQGNAVINYTEERIPYTRIHEHKHFAPWETHEKSVAFREYSKATGPADIPYYPIGLTDDKNLFQKYEDLAVNQTGVTFFGRLGTYRYLDMDQVIGEAIDLAHLVIQGVGKSHPLPSFGPKRTK